MSDDGLQTPHDDSTDLAASAATSPADAPDFTLPAEPLQANGADNSRRRSRPGRPSPLVPWVTYALLVSIVVIFAATWRAGHDASGDINMAVSLAFGAKENDLIRQGQLWRLVTAVFLHGGPFHLLVNALSLYWLGTQMELVYGSRKYFLLYIVSGITGNLLSYALTPAPSLGASGALFGLVGAGLVFPLRFRALIPARTRSLILSQLAIVAVANLALSFYVPGVDKWAHIGGLIGGGLAALFLLPDALERGPRSRASNLVLSAAVAAMLAILGWAGVSQWRWAVRNPAVTVTLVLIGPNSPDPWWTLGVPLGWHQQGGALWRSPEGLVLQILDSTEAPEAVAQTIKTINALQQAGVKMDALILDGKPARHIHLQNLQHSIDIDVYLVNAYRQMLLLRFDSPVKVYPTAQQKIALVLSSLHFNHPPSRSAPVRPPSSPPSAH